MDQLHGNRQITEITVDQLVSGLPGNPAVLSTETGERNRGDAEAFVVGDKARQAVLDPNVGAGVTPVVLDREVEDELICAGIGQNHAGAQQAALAAARPGRCRFSQDDAAVYSFTAEPLQ